jgi:hypothetical protein
VTLNGPVNVIRLDRSVTGPERAVPIKDVTADEAARSPLIVSDEEKGIKENVWRGG